jgi:hypothetical protein
VKVEEWITERKAVRGEKEVRRVFCCSVPIKGLHESKKPKKRF